MPAPYRSRLVGHDVILASEEGWQELTNGKLLNAAEKAQYAALVTIDKGIAHQQNLAQLALSVILLETIDTRIAVLDRLVPEVLETHANLDAGKVYVLKLRDTA